MGSKERGYLVSAFWGEPKWETKAESYLLVLGAEGMTLISVPSFEVPYADIRDLSLVRIGGVGTVVRLALPDGDLSIFISQLSISRKFFIVNRFATKRLYKQVEARARPSRGT